MYRLLKLALSLFLLVGSVLAEKMPPRDLPVEPTIPDYVYDIPDDIKAVDPVIGFTEPVLLAQSRRLGRTSIDDDLVLKRGMVFHQDVTTACGSSTSSCTFTVCSGSANCMFPTVSGSALIVAAGLTVSAHITSAYLCNSSSGCNSGNAAATFSLCPSTECAIYDSTLGYGNDLAYVLSGAAGNSFVTVNVSATESAGWGFNVIEVEPPPGHSFSALDSAGTLSNNTCTSCKMGAPTLTATDLVFQFNDFNGTAITGPFFSSPYITDGFANGLCLDCNTSRAPTMTQGGLGGTVVSWIALKTTAGKYTTPRTMSIAAHLLPGSGSLISCSPSCPSITVPPTTSGDLLRIYEGDAFDASGPYISRVSGCGTWVVPASCKNTAPVGSGLYQSCAYNLSATSGCTGPIRVTMSTSGTNIALDYWEIHQRSGSWTYDTSGCTTNASGNNLPTGESLTLNNIAYPHAIFQTILDSGGVSGVTLYPWTTNGGSPTLYNGTIITDYFASDMLRLDTTDATAPTWAFPEFSPAATGVCADAYYHK